MLKQRFICTQTTQNNTTHSKSFVTNNQNPVFAGIPWKSTGFCNELNFSSNTKEESVVVVQYILLLLHNTQRQHTTQHTNKLNKLQNS